MFVWLFVVLFAVPIVLVLAQYYATKKNTPKLFKRLAHLTNGQFIEGPSVEKHTVNGICRGINVTFYRFSTDSSEGYHATVQMPDSTNNKTVSIFRETAVGTMNKALGAQDIEIGHALFDRQFLIQTNDPSWLKQSLQREPIYLHIKYPHLQMTLDKGILTIIRKEPQGDINELLAIMDLAAAYAISLGVHISD